jgi:uncharacterized protein
MGTRIHGLDLARAIAIAGMVLVNFQVASGSEPAPRDWFASLVDGITGRAAATFVVLAGIGVSLLARRPGARATLSKRALILLVMGYALCLLGWGGDILHYYGVYMLLCCLLLAASGRTLWVLAILLVLGHVGLLLVLDYNRGWVWENLTYVGFWEPTGFVRNLFFNGFHPLVPWLAFMLVGMWIGRLAIESTPTQIKLLASGLAAAALAEVLSRWWIASLPPGLGPEMRENLSYLLHAQSMPPAPLYMVAAGGTAIAVIALCLLLCRLPLAVAWLSPFLATGRMALTIYVGHVLVLLLWESKVMSVPVQACLFLVAAATAAWLCSRWFARGPLEYLLRWPGQGRPEP